MILTSLQILITSSVDNWDVVPDLTVVWKHCEVGESRLFSWIIGMPHINYNRSITHQRLCFPEFLCYRANAKFSESHVVRSRQNSNSDFCHNILVTLRLDIARVLELTKKVYVLYIVIYSLLNRQCKLHNFNFPFPYQCSGHSFHTEGEQTNYGVKQIAMTVYWPTSRVQSLH